MNCNEFQQKNCVNEWQISRKDKGFQEEKERSNIKRSLDFAKERHLQTILHDPKMLWGNFFFNEYPKRKLFLWIS